MISRKRFTRKPRTTRKPFRKTAFRKRSMRSTRSKLTMRNNNTNQLIAPRYITKLKYCERDTFGVSVANAAGGDLYNLNSIFDPDRTGVGHQPLGRDQLALLYNRYRVFAVSWRVEIPPGANVQTYYVFPQNNAQTLIGNSSSVMKELPHSFSKISRTDIPTVFTGRVSLPRLTGQTPTQYKAGLEYQAAFGSDPTELQTLFVGGVPFTTGAATVSYDLTLMYHVECFDPIPLTQS